MKMRKQQPYYLLKLIKIESLLIDTIKQLYYLSKSLKYNLSDAEIVRTSQGKEESLHNIKNIKYILFKAKPIKKSSSRYDFY